MNRRGFFGTIAALVAAPKALLGLSKPALRVVNHPEYFEEPVDHLTSATYRELVAEHEMTHGRFPHECEWRDLPERPAQQCLVCGDVRSKMRYVQEQLDAVWANGKPAHEIWGPAVDREDMLDVVCRTIRPCDAP